MCWDLPRAVSAFPAPGSGCFSTFSTLLFLSCRFCSWPVPSRSLLVLLCLCLWAGFCRGLPAAYLGRLAAVRDFFQGSGASSRVHRPSLRAVGHEIFIVFKFSGGSHEIHTVTELDEDLGVRTLRQSRDVFGVAPRVSSRPWLPSWGFFTPAALQRPLSRRMRMPHLRVSTGLLVAIAESTLGVTV